LRTGDHGCRESYHTGGNGAVIIGKIVLNLAPSKIQKPIADAPRVK